MRAAKYYICGPYFYSPCMNSSIFPDEKFSNLLTGNGSEFLKYLFDAYYGQLCRLAFKYVGRMDIAEDLVQDVFINIWNKRVQLNNSAEIRPYLVRSVINASINYIRSKYNKVQFTDDFSLIETDSGFNPLDSLKNSELHMLIKVSIERLPDKCRLIFLLSRFSGLTYNEIAIKLGISVKTIETQISIALKRIESSLKANGYRLPAIFF